MAIPISSIPLELDAADVDPTGDWLEVDDVDANKTKKIHPEDLVEGAGGLIDGDFPGSHAGALVRDGAGAYRALKHNLSASGPPSATDDSDSDYAVGSRWVDTTNGRTWECVDASSGAAVWVALSSPASSTDHAVPRFDGTGGALQDSAVTVDDAGNISLPASRTVDGRDISADGAALDGHVGSTANPHSTSLQHAIDQQAGAAVDVDTTKPVHLQNSSDLDPLLVLGGGAPATNLEVRKSGGQAILRIDGLGDIRTPDETAVGAGAESLAIAAGEGGPAEQATSTVGGGGGALTIAGGAGGDVPLGESATAGDGGDVTVTAGSGGSGGLSGTAGVGGDLRLQSGAGPGSEGTGRVGSAFVGAPFNPASGLPITGFGNVAIYTGAEPTPSAAGEILVDAEGPLTLDGSSIASGSGSTPWTHDGDLTVTGTLKGRPQIATDAGTSISISDADNGKVIRCTAATTVTVTVPEGLTPGTTVELVQEGAGQIQVTGSGLLRHPATFNPHTAEQWSTIVITVLDTDEALVRGDLEAA